MQGRLCVFKDFIRGSQCPFKDSIRGSLCPFKGFIQGSLCPFKGSIRGSLCPVKDSIRGNLCPFKGSIRGSLCPFKGFLYGVVLVVCPLLDFVQPTSFKFGDLWAQVFCMLPWVQICFLTVVGKCFGAPSMRVAEQLISHVVIGKCALHLAEQADCFYQSRCDWQVRPPPCWTSRLLLSVTLWLASAPSTLLNKQTAFISHVVIGKCALHLAEQADCFQWSLLSVHGASVNKLCWMC